jgi:hypothetical protein
MFNDRGAQLYERQPYGASEKAHDEIEPEKSTHSIYILHRHLLVGSDMCFGVIQCARSGWTRKRNDEEHIEKEGKEGK